ncbi:MAG: lytic murein transglycosylase B [Betaproteobacteria bacterium]|nr:lytic murein transglycosylase B [Betaproteobacteria bacterium]
MRNNLRVTPRDVDIIRRRLCIAATGTTLAAPLAAIATSPRREAAAIVGPRYAGHAAIAAFAAEVGARRELPVRWLLGRLDQARRNDAVRRLIAPPPAGTPKNWRAYRERFVEPRRVAAGLAFWHAHEAALNEAEARFGVPPEIVLGIVGVETFYGRIMGSFRVVDALATLAFDHPPVPPARRDRSAFFRSELEEFFVWCAREGNDPLAPLGSYAGAMGLPQFMPSSINRYAIDFDGDGRIDLVGNGADVAGSVARYLAEFGWKAGLATHYAAVPPAAPDALAVLREKDILPTFSAAQMVERGVGLDERARAHEGLLAFVELENGGDAPTHVAGSTNFYAITRYNWSSYYAMAVIELAGALKAGR